MQPGALQTVLGNLTRLQRKVHDEVVIKYDKIDNVSYNPGDASTMFKQAYEGSASLTCVCLRPDPLLCSIENQGGLTAAARRLDDIARFILWCIGCAASLANSLGVLTQVKFANLRVAKGGATRFHIRVAKVK